VTWAKFWYDIFNPWTSTMPLIIYLHISCHIVLVIEGGGAAQIFERGGKWHAKHVFTQRFLRGFTVRYVNSSKWVYCHVS
jgi:hypothetical protein